jgi:hypothetical protein
MTEKRVENRRLVGGDYFNLIYTKIVTRGKPLKEYLHLFNFDDYWCFKMTNVQVQATYDDFINFRKSGYAFFHKSKYTLNSINEWIDWFKIRGGIQYLSKPTPPFSPNKIKIIK